LLPSTTPIAPSSSINPFLDNYSLSFSFNASIAQTICYNKIDMNYFVIILLVVNFLWLGYLTLIVYRKSLSLGKNNNKLLDPVRPYKINLTRFNPFGELGGDQSFILCLLDNVNSGVIITSLHNRDSTRVYAKAIKNGESDNLALSKEETKALIKTINS
jgi:Protein of unknown function (DUF4446)